MQVKDVGMYILLVGAAVFVIGIISALANPWALLGGNVTVVLALGMFLLVLGLVIAFIGVLIERLEEYRKGE